MRQQESSPMAIDLAPRQPMIHFDFEPFLRSSACYRPTTPIPSGDSVHGNPPGPKCDPLRDHFESEPSLAHFESANALQCADRSSYRIDEQPIRPEWPCRSSHACSNIARNLRRKTPKQYSHPSIEPTQGASRKPNGLRQPGKGQGKHCVET